MDRLQETPTNSRGIAILPALLFDPGFFHHRSRSRLSQVMDGRMQGPDRFRDHSGRRSSRFSGATLSTFDFFHLLGRAI